MRGTSRDKLRVERRQKAVAEEYLKGMNQTTIADLHKVERSTIKRDLRHIVASWQREYSDVYRRKVEATLARLDLVERTYWEAWERSITAKCPGNPSFLQGVERVIEQRAKILGAFAPPKAPVDAQGRPVLGVLVVPAQQCGASWDALARNYQDELEKAEIEATEAALKMPHKEMSH